MKKYRINYSYRIFYSEKRKLWIAEKRYFILWIRRGWVDSEIICLNYGWETSNFKSKIKKLK